MHRKRNMGNSMEFLVCGKQIHVAFLLVYSWNLLIIRNHAFACIHWVICVANDENRFRWISCPKVSACNRNRVHMCTSRANKMSSRWKSTGISSSSTLIWGYGEYMMRTLWNGSNSDRQSRIYGVSKCFKMFSRIRACYVL